MKPATFDENIHLSLLNELYRAFDFFNKKYAAKKLVRPVIAISPAGKKKAQGWFCNDIWSHKDKTMHEINICTESFGKGMDNTFDTLLHEMAHLKNFQNNIDDCTEQPS